MFPNTSYWNSNTVEPSAITKSRKPRNAILAKFNKNEKSSTNSEKSCKVEKKSRNNSVNDSQNSKKASVPRESKDHDYYTSPIKLMSRMALAEIEEDKHILRKVNICTSDIEPDEENDPTNMFIRDPPMTDEQILKTYRSVVSVVYYYNPFTHVA